MTSSAWRIENRIGSGLFVISQEHGTLLFRIDPKTMTIYPYDKKCKGEIAIALSDLHRLNTATQTPAPIFGDVVLRANPI